MEIPPAPPAPKVHGNNSQSIILPPKFEARSMIPQTIRSLPEVCGNNYKHRYALIKKKN